MDSTTHTYWISIGRNVGSEPMSDDDWTRFRSIVRASVLAVSGNALATVNGQSEWGGEPEETYLLLATVPAANVDGLRRYLRRACKDYRQDAIGFVGGAGTDTLIGGE